MKLPFFPSRPSSALKREYFIALQIGSGLVRCAVWAVANGHPQVLSVGPAASWSDSNQDSLLESSDRTLSEAVNRLDPTGKISPEKVILGLPRNWVESEKILPSYQPLLRSLFSHLELKPIGFVITAEAIIRHLQHSESVPPTAILIGLGTDFLEVSLVKLGKTIISNSVKRSPNVSDDVREGLTRFLPQDIFPSRMLMYGLGGDLEQIRQQLLAFPWQSPQNRFPFLHFPKIEPLSEDFSIRSIALAGGGEAAQAIGLVPHPEPAATAPSTDLSPADLGFSSDFHAVPSASPVETVVEGEISAPTPPPLPRTRFKLPKFSVPALPRPTRLIAVIAVVVALVITPIFVYLFVLQAAVRLQISPVIITSQLDLVVDTAAAGIDVQSSVLPGRVVKTSHADAKTISSSGSKIIGDRSTGEVTLVNGTGSSKNLSKGTVLTSSSGLKFVLDNAATVASASGTADPNSYQPGTSKVKVTASQIGSESNLSAGTQFQVGTFSTLDLVARNDAALSGGSSRSVKAVAKEDLANLRSALSSQLKEGVIQKLQQEISENEMILPGSQQTQISQEDFSHGLGDEAEEVSLRLTVDSSALAISSLDLGQLMAQKSASDTPQNYQLSRLTDQKFTLRKSQGTKTPIFAEISASFVPSLKSDELAGQLAGKSRPAAQSLLRSLPGVAEVSVSFNLPFPDAVFLLMPRSPDRINVSVEP